MRKQTGLTRIDAAVALACIALVLAQAAVLNAGGRERSKKEVCLANMRMLTAAWQMYANDNAGKIVNGGQPWSNNPTPKEPYWCTPLPPVPMTDEVGTFPITRFDWDITPAYSGVALPYAERVSLLKRGALYGYVQNPDIYRCPEADKTAHRSYVMPTSMNAAWTFDPICFPSVKVAKSTGQIVKPNEKIVFLEEKTITPDAFMFPASVTCGLFDRLSITHDSGANFAFADGHAKYHRWECQSTITWASGGNPPSPSDTCFTTKDWAWLQNAIWGN
jgi:prepilin-type processing-associated H-X9-DG protein